MTCSIRAHTQPHPEVIRRLTPEFRTILFLVSVCGLMAVSSAGDLNAQAVGVPFRYPVESNHISVSLPGTFNGWNNGSSTAMQKVDSLGQWYRRNTLVVGQTVEYKFFASTAAGSSWITDPNNPRTNPADHNNSVLTVSNPMVVQPIPQLGDGGLVTHFTAGIVASGAVQSLTLSVAGAAGVDVLSSFNPSTGVVRVALDQPVVTGTRFDLSVTTTAGSASATTGTLTGGLTIRTPSRRTVGATLRLAGSATSATGQIDPALTSVSVLREGVWWQDLPVVDGQVSGLVTLVEGTNRFRLAATIGGQAFESEEVVITRWKGPYEERLLDLEVTGSSGVFTIQAVETARSPGLSSIEFIPDEQLSTSGFLQFVAGGLVAVGTASGPGELYVTVLATAVDGSTDKARAAIRVAEDGSISTFEWADKASWIDQAVVYEVFPLSFGPTQATGTVGNEGNRFNQIRANLDYIRGMGFNTIWFMPIMHNADMTQLGGGYNIIDFYTVDPKLGTNEDFRALVERAHELGLRVILDITVNHSGDTHPWVQSLAEGGTYADFIQTSPSSYSRGMDGSGPYLPEVWSNNGLYRVFDGFGQLANLNWDTNDLQAEMLDILAYWITEFDVDGYRFDAYWGPWKRYGPARFGQPIRQLMRRLRPDAFSLGELAGTGTGTEVYYADDDNGTPVAGGLDAAYDWTFSHLMRNPSSYGRISDYRTLIPNYGFVPGPNSRFFRFLENHDETRLQEVFKSNTDQIRPLTGMLLTIPGIPMIYQGQEVGYGQGSGDRRRLPVNWNTDRNGEWASFHRLLAATRERFPAFGTQDISFLSSAGSTLAFVRPFQDENAVVAINFSAGTRSFLLDPSSAVRMSTDGPIPYYDVAADTSGAHLGAFEVTLAPYSMVTYITSDDARMDLGPLPSLPFGAVYTSTASEPELPEGAGLSAPWPNPAQETVRMDWFLDHPAHVRLELFDLLGRRVGLLEDGIHAAGQHESSFDVGTLGPGVYRIRMMTEGRTLSRSLVVVR